MASEFDILRQRAQQQAAAQGQQNESAIQRRFARLGMLNSGAAIKQQQLGQEAAQAEGNKAIENIGFAEAQENKRVGEIKQAQEFAAGENLKQREFGSLEAEKGRGFAREEGATQRTFAEKMQQGQNIYQSEEANKARDFAAGQSNLDRAQQKDLALKQLALSAKGLALEADAQKFNKELAKWQQGQPTDLLGQLLGPSFSTSGGKGKSNMLGDVAGLTTKLNPMVQAPKAAGKILGIF